MVSASDLTNITLANIIRPAFNELPAADHEAFEKHLAELVEKAKENYCSNFNMDRHHNVVKENDFDITTLIAAPNVSASQPAALTMNDGEKAISNHGSKFEKLLRDLDKKVDRMHGKSVTPVFHRTIRPTKRPHQ